MEKTYYLHSEDLSGNIIHMDHKQAEIDTCKPAHRTHIHGGLHTSLQVDTHRQSGEGQGKRAKVKAQACNLKGQRRVTKVTLCGGRGTTSMI